MKDAKGHGSNPRGAHSEGIGMIGQMTPIEQVRPTEDISKMTTASDMELIHSIRGSIRSGKQAPPVVVRPNGTIVDGHHRYIAYKAERSTSIPTIPLARWVELGRPNEGTNGRGV